MISCVQITPLAPFKEYMRKRAKFMISEEMLSYTLFKNLDYKIEYIEANKDQNIFNIFVSSDSLPELSEGEDCKCIMIDHEYNVSIRDP
jgi:hypothetical protein